MDLVRTFNQRQTQDITRPNLKPGDVVRVTMKVKEGEKERLQVFEGTVLGIRGGGPSVTCTVRREVGSFGVERIFPLYSPLITEIEIVRRQKVRRAKLNYLRQMARRRFKDDVLAMQRHVKEEDNKKRLAEAQAKNTSPDSPAGESPSPSKGEGSDTKASDNKTLEAGAESAGKTE